MWRLGLLAVAVIAAVGGAVAAKLHTRFVRPIFCSNVPCAYLNGRLSVIGQMIAARPVGSVYFVIGDSLTEAGLWPELCGLKPVPAGIAAATSDTWVPHAKAMTDALKPAAVVLALGTNDVLVAGRLGNYEALVASLSGYRLVALPVYQLAAVSRETVAVANARIAKAVPQVAEPITATTFDSVHMTTSDYQRWFGSLERVLCKP